MSDSLKDKVILITGAGSGIGRATALACAREGARIVVPDLNRKWSTETPGGGTFLSPSSSRPRNRYLNSLRSQIPFVRPYSANPLPTVEIYSLFFHRLSE